MEAFNLKKNIYVNAVCMQLNMKAKLGGDKIPVDVNCINNLIWINIMLLAKNKFVYLFRNICPFTWILIDRNTYII